MKIINYYMKIKLSESKLKQIIYESVKSILKESNECPNCGNESEHSIRFTSKGDKNWSALLFMA